MAKFNITAPDGKTYTVNAPDGATQEDVLAYAQKNYKMAAAVKPDEQFGQRLNREIANIPHAFGLAGRNIIEATGDFADTLATPFRAGLNAITPKQQTLSGLVTGAEPQDRFQTGNGKKIADWLNLPEARDSYDRLAGDIEKGITNTALPFGVASKLAKATTGTTQAVSKLLTANPAQQLASGAAAAAAGGYTRETGGDSGSQLAATLAAGIATPFAINGGQKVIQAGKNLFSSGVGNTQIDVTINNALKDSGYTLADLPQNVINGMRNDVTEALKINPSLSPDSIRRLADYKLVGATPTQARLTLDPGDITRQANLAKNGINLKDASAQRLGQVENLNNRGFINSLNDMGASKGLESEIAGGNMSGDLSRFADAQKANISNLYTAAKDSSGRSANLDPSNFTQSAGNLLREKNLEAFIPAEIRSMLNGFAEGKAPLTVDTAEQFKTIIGNSQRASNDGNVRTALGLIRSSLDDTPLLGAQNVGGNQVALQGAAGVGQDTIDAYNAARSANRTFMGTVESTPALKAAMDEASSKGFFQKHVIAGDAKSLGATINVLGDEGKDLIKNQVLTHLKEKAISNAADEVGKFSQSQYNGALKMLGSSKLEMLFNSDEIKQLRALGRVASYEQVQPIGSAVNNSNTTGAITGLLDKIGNSSLLSKMPLGKLISEPASNAAIGINSVRALSVPQSLGATMMRKEPAGLLMSPGIFMPSTSEEEQRKRGLLFP